MAVSAARQTVGVSAVALNTASTSGIDLIIHNASANDADLGPVGVAAGSGFLLKANTTVSVRLDPGDVLYAVRTGAADAVLAVLRT